MNLREKAEETWSAISWQHKPNAVRAIENRLKEVRNETLERVYNIAKVDELELVSAKQIRELIDALNVVAGKE